MFGWLMKKLRPAAPEWTCRMGWRVLTYQEGEQWLSLQIEPMSDAPCRVYLPDDARWQVHAPAWARDRRALIVQRLQQVAWNRALTWQDSPRANFWQRHVLQPVDGSLEATPGGQQLQNLWLFHPDSPARWSRQDAKRAWCAGAEQMCKQASGWVNIDVRERVPGSVFQDLELPTLSRNPRVTLSFVAA
jgi:hypothetical protein